MTACRARSRRFRFIRSPYRFITHFCLNELIYIHENTTARSRTRVLIEYLCREPNPRRKGGELFTPKLSQNATILDHFSHKTLLNTSSISTKLYQSSLAATCVTIRALHLEIWVVATIIYLLFSWWINRGLIYPEIVTWLVHNWSKCEQKLISDCSKYFKTKKWKPTT